MTAATQASSSIAVVTQTDIHRLISTKRQNLKSDATIAKVFPSSRCFTSIPYRRSFGRTGRSMCQMPKTKNKRTTFCAVRTDVHDFYFNVLILIEIYACRRQPTTSNDNARQYSQKLKRRTTTTTVRFFFLPYFIPVHFIHISCSRITPHRRNNFNLNFLHLK